MEYNLKRIRIKENFMREFFYEGHLEIVKALTLAKADLNVKNKLGMTALDIAKLMGHLEIEKWLASLGAVAGIDTENRADLDKTEGNNKLIPQQKKGQLSPCKETVKKL